MRSTRVRRLAAFLGAMFLLVQSASADHGTCFVTLGSNGTGDYSDVTITLDFDGHEPGTMELQWPTGWSIAQHTGTSPITPIPNDEDTVGYGTWKAKWLHLFCAESTLNFTVTWESTIDGGAPTNTVGQLTVTLSGLFTTQVYVVRNAANDYDFEFPDMPDSAVCSSTTDQVMTTTYHATVPGSSPARRFLRNPATTGTYEWCFVYTDTAATTHSTCCSTTIA